MSRKQKPSFYEKLRYVYANGYFPFVFRFAKVTTFHLICELLLTSYLIEMLIFMSNFFLNVEGLPFQPTSILLIVVPLLIAIPSAIAYGLICVVYFASTVYKFHMEYNNPKYQLETIMKKYRSHVVKIHSVGITWYFLVSFIIPHALLIIEKNAFAEPKNILIAIPVVGTLLGIAWNITGIFRNQRLVWHELLPHLNDIENRKKVALFNYKMILANVIGNAISVAFIISILIVILLNLQKELLSDDPLVQVFVDYGTLLVTFITLVGVYVRFLYKLIYSKKEKEQRIYPSLSSVLNTSSNN